jgi:hypothetical protein
VRFLDRESSRNTAGKWEIGAPWRIKDQNIAATDEVAVVCTVSAGAAFG